MSILNLNKALMYGFHYDYIKNKYGNKSRLLFTKSLIYQIQSEDAYEDFHQHKGTFDFSNYSAKSKCYEILNALLVSKMKDETSALSIKKCAELKSKMCSFIVDDSSEHKTIKGVNKNDVTKIGRNNHKDVLLNKKYLRYAMNRIKIKIIKYELTKSSKFFCLAFMTKSLFSILNMTHQLLVFEVDYNFVI